MTNVAISSSEEIFALLEREAIAPGVAPDDVPARMLGEQFAPTDAGSPTDPEFIAAMGASFRQNRSLLRRLGDLDER